MSVRKFKTESKRILDLMIHSIYTNKEIFLRELISNASDAIDKYHFKSLTEELPQREYGIHISFNEADRTITIEDNGIGMTKDELINNLGTIAKSGSKEFMEQLEDNTETDIIGQFGVGFYSSFMVGDKIEVFSKSVDSDTAYQWVSTGEETFTIKESDEELEGTKIIIHLREDTEEFKYSKYLSDYYLKNLVKTYSDYVKYPITMNVNVKEDEYELQTINSMKPIWKKSKSELEDEEINNFYKHQFREFDEPLYTIQSNVEGNISFNSLLFIPKKQPYDLYQKGFKKGLQLFSKGVYIQEHSEEVVDDWMLFVKGVVDTSDISLNISREILQDTYHLEKIRNILEKKVRNTLLKSLENEKEKYIEFFNEFGRIIKYGLYQSFGSKKDLLEDLLLFNTNKRDHITLAEYIEGLEEEAKIYYSTGASKKQILAQPQMDVIKSQDLEVILLTEDVDEFLVKMLMDYKKHPFTSILDADFDFGEIDEEIEKTSKNMLEAIKEALKDEVEDVVLSKRLTDSPVCLVSKDGLSFEMEKVLAQMPGENQKAKRVLELNPNHQLFKSLETLYDQDLASLGEYASLLYDQALLIEGLPIENPVEFSNKMCNLMIKTVKG